jgi:CP family cyanate transporter-like MFS transporter
MLTVAPVVCFAIGAFFVPRMLRWISPNHAIAIALLLMFIGGTVRLATAVSTLLLGTVICGVGAAIGNIMGGIVTRRDFAGRVGLVMGLYVGVMSVSSSTAAMISFPVSQRLGGWRPALAIWSMLALVVFVIWTLTQAGHRENKPMITRGSYRRIARNKSAWWLVLYFGFQSTNFHSLAGWLPSILRDAGIDGTQAGLMVSLMILLGVPAGIVVPILAARSQSQRGLVVGIVVSGLVGLTGVMLAPTVAPWAWVSFLGLSVGSSFPLALTIVVTKSDSTEAARDLNSFMQSWGYVISAIGPFALGALRDSTGGWTVAVGALVVGTFIQLIAGLVIAGPGHIHVDEVATS